MRNKKLFLLTLICILFTVDVFPQSFTDYANKMREQIQQLKDINQQREDIIASKDYEIGELQAKNEELAAKNEEVIKESEEAVTELIRRAETIKRQNKILCIVVLIFVIKFMISIALIVVNGKFKISIPYWLNAIL